MTGLSFHIYPFGCQMNAHQAQALAGELARAGMVPASSPEEADAVLYFTCSVRQHAEDRVWSHLGRWRRKRASGQLRLLGVLGCMAERLGEGIAKRMDHVDLIIGPGRLGEARELISRALGGEGPRPRVATGSFENVCALDASRASLPRSFQAYLPVMEGCGCVCLYCVVPGVRGPERSLPPEEVERRARLLIERGVVEITLLGQNIDRYGRTLSPRSSLAELLRRLSPLRGLERLRFITSNPRDVTNDLLQAVADLPNVMPYLHIPAQSGSDRVLAAMRRGYTRARYLEVVEAARSIAPGVGIASDFIVGFPGETDSDFEMTLSLLREARFQSSFVFKYSPRPGTAAARLEDDVPQDVKKERHRLLSEAQHGISLELNRAFIGRKVKVLCEGASKTDPSRWTGRTESFRIAAFTSGRDPTGKLVDVLVEDATSLVLLGREGEQRAVG